MKTRKLRLLAYSLAVFTVIAGITAYLTTADQATNVFKAEPSKELAVLAPGAWTDTPLFDQVILCNAREDEALSGSIQNICTEVFGSQTEHLLGSDVTTNDADTVWSYFSE